MKNRKNGYSKVDLIEERVNIMSEQIKSIEEKISELSEKIDLKFDNLLNSLEKNYVNIKEFQPVKLIVYGMVGLVLTSFMATLIYLVGWNR